MAGWKTTQTGLLAPGTPGQYGPALARKVCLLGDPAVGKSSLVQRMAGRRFSELYVTTVGASVLKKTVTVRPAGAAADVRVALMIWEINGHLPPSVVQPFLYGTDAAIVVADAARLDTQIDLWKWIEAARSHRGAIPVTVLVNKADIMEPGFDHELVADLSGEYRCTCRLASARTGRNVDSLLHEVAARLAIQSGRCG